MERFNSARCAEDEKQQVELLFVQFQSTLTTSYKIASHLPHHWFPHHFICGFSIAIINTLYHLLICYIYWLMSTLLTFTRICFRRAGPLVCFMSSVLRTVSVPLKLFNNYLWNGMNLIIQLLSAWMAIGKFSEDGGSEKAGSMRKGWVNSAWGPLESEVPLKHLNRPQSRAETEGQDSMLRWHSVFVLCNLILTSHVWYILKDLFLGKSSIFIVLIYSGRHNNLTFLWHHLSSRASRLLCWEVSSLTVLHLLL